MPRFDDFSKGLALGIGAAILIPVAISTLAPVLKPVARSAVKTGLRAAEKGREVLAESVEKFEDLVAETQAEMRAGHMNSATQPETEPTAATEAESEPGADTEGSGQPAGHTEDAADNSNVRKFVNE